MADHKASSFAGAVINCISVVGSLAGTNRVAPLPEHVAGYACAGEGGRLPLRFYVDLIVNSAILF